MALDTTLYDSSDTTSLYHMLDICDDTHFGIAQITYALLKNDFLYIDEQWYEYNTNLLCWCKIQRDHRLRVMISTLVSATYANRAEYLFNKSMSDDIDVSEKIRFGYISRSLFKIATKLKSYNFKGSVIKECKCLFYVEEIPNH